MESRWSPALGALLGPALPVLASPLPLPLPASRSASEFPSELSSSSKLKGLLRLAPFMCAPASYQLKFKFDADQRPLYLLLPPGAGCVGLDDMLPLDMLAPCICCHEERQTLW